MSGWSPMTTRREFVRAMVAATAMVAAAAAASRLRPVAVAPGDRIAFDLSAIVPERLGEWTIDRSIAPVMPTPELQQVIEQTYDQTLARTYLNAAGQRVMLSIAYSRGYGKEMLTHRPEVCYPAQGFDVRRVSDRTILATPFGAVRTTRLVASTISRIEPITYWLVIDETQSAFGLDMKLAQLRHAFKGRIADGMLVRVSSIGRDTDSQFELQAGFVNDLVREISGTARSRIAGLRSSAES